MSICNNGLVQSDFSATNLSATKQLHAQRLTACLAEIGTLNVVNELILPGGIEITSDNPPIIQLTGDIGIAIADTNGNINLPGAGGILTTATGPNTMRVADRRNLSPYVVGPDPIDSEYQSIQAAMDQAVADGVTAANPGAILIKNSIYTENLIVPNGVRLIGLANQFNAPTINGTILVNAVAGGIYGFSNLLITSDQPITFDYVHAAVGPIPFLFIEGVTVDNTFGGGGFAVRTSGFGAAFIFRSRFNADGAAGVAYDSQTVDNRQEFFYCNFNSNGGRSLRVGIIGATSDVNFIECEFNNGIVEFLDFDGSASSLRECIFGGPVNIISPSLSIFHVERCSFSDLVTVATPGIGQVQLSFFACLFDNNGGLSVTNNNLNTQISLASCEFDQTALVFDGSQYILTVSNTTITPSIGSAIAVTINATNLRYNEWANNNIINSQAASEAISIADAATSATTFLSNNTFSTFLAQAGGNAVVSPAAVNSANNTLIGYTTYSVAPTALVSI